MKQKSSQKTGNEYEEHLKEILRSELDAKARITYLSGRGTDKSDVYLPGFSIEIECKNQKTIKLIDWWEQCKRQEINNLSVLALTNPRKPKMKETLIVMDLYDWIELIKNQKEKDEVESATDKNFKWRVKRLRDAAHDVFKNL